MGLVFLLSCKTGSAFRVLVDHRLYVHSLAEKKAGKRNYLQKQVALLGGRVIRWKISLFVFFFERLLKCRKRTKMPGNPKTENGSQMTRMYFFNLNSHRSRLRTWGDLVRPSERVSHSVVSDSLWPHGLQLQGSSVHRILQTRILEWVAILFSRRSSQHRVQNLVCIADGFFTFWATRVWRWVRMGEWQTGCPRVLRFGFWLSDPYNFSILWRPRGAPCILWVYSWLFPLSENESRACE